MAPGLIGRLFIQLVSAFLLNLECAIGGRYLLLLFTLDTSTRRVGYKGGRTGYASRAPKIIWAEELRGFRSLPTTILVGLSGMAPWIATLDT
jgi:hypothetical protein